MSRDLHINSIYEAFLKHNSSGIISFSGYNYIVKIFKIVDHVHYLFIVIINPRMGIYSGLKLLHCNTCENSGVS